MVGGGCRLLQLCPLSSCSLAGQGHTPVLTWPAEPALTGMCLEAEHSHGF